ncbi:metallophosphoesterase [Stenotrophomonas sp. LGBM10]|uniref:metallophosphoesterase n=1 Tax=Stenotrophomonas sp. LGBM10 TaxID=3390038 RepID=UPI00398BA5E8
MPLWARGVLALLVVAMGLHHRIVATFAGTMASPEIPGPLIVVLATGFIALLLGALALLLLDGLLLGARLLRRPQAVAALRRPWLRPAAGAVALLLSAYGIQQGIAVPKTRQIEVAIVGLPAQFDGYRLLQLTDLHASRLLTGEWVAKVVARSNALAPDLVVITGDLVDGTVAARADDVRPLGQLHAPDGVIAITGNHEYYADHAAWMHTFRDMGMQVLENSHTQIRRNGATLTVAGVTDPVATRYDLPMPDLDAALAGADRAAPVILLDHRPREARAHAARGVALQLSGHTHGGHIVGMDQLVKRANGGFVSGRYAVDGMTLYVSNGAGLWPGFAARIGVPSEITLITLRSARQP